MTTAPVEVPIPSDGGAYTTRPFTFIPRANLGVAPIIVSWSDVAAYIVRVDASVENLDSDILRAEWADGAQRGKLPTEFMVAWRGPGADMSRMPGKGGFYGAWSFFRDDFSDRWFVKNPFSAWDECAQYEADLAKWRKRFQEVGGKPSAPATGDVPRNGPSPLPVVADLAKTLAWMGGLALAAYVAFKVSS